MVFLSIVSFLVFSVLFTSEHDAADLMDGFDRLTRLEKSANQQVEKLVENPLIGPPSRKVRERLEKLTGIALWVSRRHLESGLTTSIRNRFLK